MSQTIARRDGLIQFFLCNSEIKVLTCRISRGRQRIARTTLPSIREAAPMAAEASALQG